MVSSILKYIYIYTVPYGNHTVLWVCSELRRGGGSRWLRMPIAQVEDKPFRSETHLFSFLRKFPRHPLIRHFSSAPPPYTLVTPPGAWHGAERCSNYFHSRRRRLPCHGDSTLKSRVTQGEMIIAWLPGRDGSPLS